MNDENEEKLMFSFKIKNCQKGYYYKIYVESKEEEIDSFETEEILCENGGEDISFQDKMDCIFIFEKKQQISIITQKRKLYSNEEDIKKIKRDKYLSSLVIMNGGIYEKQLSNDYDSENLYIKLDKVKEEKNKRYLFDFLKKGTTLSCFISFDFSKTAKGNIIESNKNILKYIFQALEIYTLDKFFYPSGFGAKVKDTKSTVFDMSKTELSSDNLLEQYKIFLESNIIPEKKIKVSSLIKKLIVDVTKLFEPKIYNISFILLSQDIEETDIKKAIDNSIESSYLPLSIIAIGVGDHDFSVAKKIFENKKKHSSSEMEKLRNNVIFTKLKSHPSSSEMITFCLRKLYKQIIEYYELNKYDPEKDEKENKKNLMGSISVIGSICDNDPAPTSINTAEVTPEFDSQNNLTNSDNTNTANSQNYINNINTSNSNVSNGSYQLKTSTYSCPMFQVNPYISTKKEKEEKKESKSNNPN